MNIYAYTINRLTSTIKYQNTNRLRYFLTCVSCHDDSCEGFPLVLVEHFGVHPVGQVHGERKTIQLEQPPRDVLVYLVKMNIPSELYVGTCPLPTSTYLNEHTFSNYFTPLPYLALVKKIFIAGPTQKVNLPTYL